MLAVLALVALLAYLIVVDLGANAGKVHHGVSVEGYEVSGLTESDAFGKLEARAEELEETGIVFRKGPLSFRFVPSDLNWSFKVDETTDRAMGVGRTGGPFRAVWDRATAWISGVEVEWAGSFFPRGRLAGSFNSLEERAALFGYVIDRNALRREMREAIKDLPRLSSYEIPLVETD
jgi:hypothetical protein